MHEIKNITITPEILKLIEFKGRWTVIETLAPEKLTSLRRIATIESVGSVSPNYRDVFGLYLKCPHEGLASGRS